MSGLVSRTMQDTPIVTLYRRYSEITAAADANPNPDDVDLEGLYYKERDRIEDAIDALPCLGPADFAAKAIVATAKGELSLDWENDPLWKEARALLRGNDSQTAH